MSLSLSQRLSLIAPSATLEISKKAAALKSQGVDVISFGVGEPDFQTPEAIRTAAKAAIDTKASHYTAVCGIKPLLEAIAKNSKARRGIEHATDEIMVSVGAKHSLYNLSVALYDPGDEVIIPAPYWVSYPEQVTLAGAKPVIVETKESDGFCLTKDALEAAITPKTKALILCTPSNPTGAAYSKEKLEAICEVARKHAFYIITDEIYSQLVYGGFEQKSILEIAPDLKDRIIVVDGVSKTYAMTGWRIGWILAPKQVVKACDMIQGQSTTNPAAVSQYAALEALVMDRKPIEDMRKAFEARRNLIVKGINDIPGLSCRMPEGAFYAFVDGTKLLGKSANGTILKDDIDLCGWLLTGARCALVPGSAFGAPGYMRMSYATSEALITEGLKRIREAVASLA